uniref:Uncharacterized protein n=1 Tax=Oryza meridionalis TaxID=40149 RepID=A0A0E0DB06_9ORYZ
MDCEEEQGATLPSLLMPSPSLVGPLALPVMVAVVEKASLRRGRTRWCRHGGDGWPSLSVMAAAVEKVGRRGGWARWWQQQWRRPIGVEAGRGGGGGGGSSACTIGAMVPTNWYRLENRHQYRQKLDMAMIVEAFASDLCNLISEIRAKRVPVLSMEHSYVDELETSILRIRDFFVAHTDYMKGNEDVAALVRAVKDAMYHASDALSLLLLKIQEREQSTVCCTGFPNYGDIMFRRGIAVLGRQMNLLLREHATFGLAERGLPGRRSRLDVDRIYHTQSMALPVPDMVRDHQMKQDSEKIIKHIVMNRRPADDVTVVAIVGAPGIGKTVLANIIFNSYSVQDHFHAKIWLNVTRNCSELDLLQSAISPFRAVDERFSDKSRLASELRQYFQNRSLMLVMDDVWSAETWNDLLRHPLSSCAPGSCVIATTRNKNVAAMMQASHIHRVHKLKPDVSWSLLKKQRRTKVAWEYVLKDQQWSKTGLPEVLNESVYLSYDDLSPRLKQCFLYCSMFPEGETIDCDKVVQMWIAEGFIPGDENSKLPEVLGQEYYTELVTRNLLEPIDGNFDESRWAMHSVFHSFAQYLAKEEALLLREGQNTSNLSQRFRRISVSRKEVEYSDIQKQKSLRALVSFGSINLKSGDSLGALPYLRILHVNNTEISTLLGSLYHLKLLKYLDLSNTDVSSLPCNIGKMKCLQYICVHGCQKLKQLHKSIVNLHKLRFLDISDTSVKTVPKGFGRLINLVSLKGFPIHTDDNGKCTLEELEPLSKLMHLTVWGLQNISANCSSTGAKLSDKTHLTSLWLRCTTTEGNELQSQEVFDDLCPSPSLEHLTITGYFGCRLPKWLMSTVLDNLRMLKLENLPSCTELPYSLGQLPNLESLRVQHARRIRYIGEEFFLPSTLGDDSESDQDERSIRSLVDQYNRSMAVSTAFPKLIKLVFYGLLGWKVWDWEQNLEAMPALQNLQISRCRLSHLPPGLSCQAVALRVMTIERVMELHSVENFGSVVELYLHSNSNLEKIAYLPKMEMLRISKCPKLKVLEEVEALSSMELKDYEMRTLPEYLKSLELRQLKIDCTLKLLHMISQRDAALEWEKISHIENIEAYADGFDDNKRLHVFYTKETDSFKIHLGEYGAPSKSTDTEDIDAAAGQLEQENNHEEHVTGSELPTSEQSTHGSETKRRTHHSPLPRYDLD